MIARITILVLLSVIFHNPILGQDVHFTQFGNSPLSLNPALTGQFKGDWRIANIHRRQWGSIALPFVTNAISYDRPLYLYREKFAGGVIWVHDQSGDTRLVVNKLLLSGAYHKKWGEQKVSMGFQGGWVRKSYQFGNYSFPDQFDRNTGNFNANAPTAETTILPPINYLDLNVGVFWTTRINQFEPEAGWALFHFNTPRESFYDNEILLPIRQVITLGGTYHFSNTFRLKPRFLYMSHNKASDLLVGFDADMSVAPNDLQVKAAFGGILFRDGFRRNTDAFAVRVGLRFTKIEAGMAYDINVSELQAATNNRGAIELFLVYTSPSTLLKKNALPCDRF